MSKGRPMEWIKYDPVRVSLEADGLDLMGRGLYFTMISHFWHNGPMTEALLQRVCRERSADMLARAVRVGESEPPVYSFLWLEEARAYGKATHQQRVDAGVASIAKRNAAKRPLNDHSMAADARSADAERPFFSLSLSSSPSESEKGKDAASAAPGEPPSPPPPPPPPPPPDPAPVVEQAPFFDDWWNLYDKKIDRTKCEAKWKRLKQKEREDAFAHTKLYVEATPEVKYRRNPETYLNNKNWNDKYLPASSAAVRGRGHSSGEEKRAAVIRANAEWYRDNEPTEAVAPDPQRNGHNDPPASDQQGGVSGASDRP